MPKLVQNLFWSLTTWPLTSDHELLHGHHFYRWWLLWQIPWWYEVSPNFTYYPPTMITSVVCKNKCFLHEQPWISPWIKLISNKLDITIHVIASQLSGNCDVIGNRLWCHQQNENRVSETREYRTPPLSHCHSRLFGCESDQISNP